MDKYILIGRQPVKVDTEHTTDLLSWAQWFGERANLHANDAPITANHVAVSVFPPRKPLTARKGDPRMVKRLNALRAEGVRISTVFLGMDHAMIGDVPLLFKTMVFGGQFHGLQRSFATWHYSEIFHSIVRDKIREAQGYGL